MRRITIIAAALATAALATTYIQTSSTGVAPWKPVKDSVSRAHLADSARKADSSRAAWKADSAHIAWFAHASTYADSARTAGAATKLATPRTISMTGDGTWSASFDGSANATGPLHLSRLLASGSAGSASSVPTLTWDTTGRLTGVGSAAISIGHNSVTDWSAATSSFLTGNQSITISGAVTGSGTTSIATAFANTHLAGINQDLMTTSYPAFSRVTTTYDVAPTASPNANYVLAPLVAQRATNGSSTSMAGVGFHNIGTVGAFLYLNNSGHFQVNLNNGEIYSLIDGDNYSSFNNFTSGLATTTLTASGSISEGDTALSSKYLGINASIPSSRISDWGTYVNQPLLTTSSPTFATVTANGGIIGQGNVGSFAQPWNAGYFSTAGIDIGDGLLKIYSPNSALALLGVAAHPISLSTASGAATFPSDLSVGGALGLSAVAVGGTTYSSAAHKGRILTIAPSTSFTLPLGAAGDWFIVQSSDIQGPNQSAGKIAPSGTTVYIRGTAYSSSTSVIGTLIAYCNGTYWYIG